MSGGGHHNAKVTGSAKAIVPVIMLVTLAASALILTQCQGDKPQPRAEARGAPESPAQEREAETPTRSEPAPPVEASRFINETPIPVSIPASGTSERFPVRRGQTTCPSEHPEEFGYLTRCHIRGTPDDQTEVYNGSNCQKTDWVVYATTDGKAKDMFLNHVRYPETCPTD